MTEEDAYSFLHGVFRELFEGDVVPTPGMKASDVPGWDSFAQISIIIATEEKFGIQFTTPELDGLTDVGAYVRTLLAKTG